MRIRITVISKFKVHQFVALVRTASSLEELHLDPITFYEKWGGSVPNGICFELEIIEPRNDFFTENLLHVHRSRKTEKPFVCYPKQISTLEQALKVFRVWCLGTVLTLDEKVDLNTIFTEECEDDMEKFVEVVYSRYDIRVSETRELSSRPPLIPA